MKGQGARQDMASSLFGGSPDVLSVLRQNNYDTSVLRTNRLLTDEEWEQIDEAVIDAAQPELTIYADMLAAGMRHNIDGLGVLQSEWRVISDVDDAEQTLTGESAVERDLVESTVTQVPIPITHKDFTIPERLRLSSERRGEGLDTSTARAAARAVARKLEDMVISGGGPALGGNSISGLLTHANRNTYTISTAWTSVTANEDITNDVIGMIAEAQADYFRGPYNLYVPSNYWTKLLEDHKANSDMTIAQRIEQIPGINAVKLADRLTASNVVLLQMTPDVADIALALQIDTLEWTSQGGLVNHFKVMAAAAPRLKPDYNGRMGLVHGS